MNSQMMRACRWPIVSFFYRSFHGKAQALVFAQHGEPIDVLQLKEISLPKCKDDEVLIKFLASTVNPADINTIQGNYAIKPPLPAVAGNEGVGKVLEVGASVKHLTVDDLVFPRDPMTGTWRSHGVYRETALQIVDRQLHPSVAAVLPVNPCTAYRLLHDFHTLQPNDIIVQNGCTSAVGIYVIQLARLLKCHTVNVMRARASEAATVLTKAQLKQFGASLVFTEAELRTPEARQLIEALGGGGGRVPLAFNCVAGKACLNLIRYLSEEAKLVSYGAMSRLPLQVPVGPMLFKDISLHGFWLSGWNQKQQSQIERSKMYEKVGQLFVNGDLLPSPYDEVPLGQWPEAIRKATFGDAIPQALPRKQILVFPD